MEQFFVDFSSIFDRFLIDFWPIFEINFDEEIAGTSVVIFVLWRMFLTFFLKIRNRVNYVDVENNMVFMG